MGRMGFSAGAGYPRRMERRPAAGCFPLSEYPPGYSC